MAMEKRIQCKDIDTEELLMRMAGSKYQGDIGWQLLNWWPMKVVIRKLEGLERRGLIKRNVTWSNAWLTDVGKEMAEQVVETRVVIHLKHFRLPDRRGNTNAVKTRP